MEELLTLVWKSRDRFNRARPEDSQFEARATFAAGVEMMVTALGPDVMRAVYTPDPTPDADRSEHLAKLAYRLFLAQRIFDDCESDSPSALRAAEDEIRAISNGDSPRLFQQLETTPGSKPRTNAYRMAKHQVRLLQWHEFLLKEGVDKKVVRHTIEGVYGVPWDTYRKWKTVVARELGQPALDRALQWATFQFRTMAMRAYDVPQAVELMRVDALALKREARKAAALPAGNPGLD